jgi:hypothetical protein
LDNTAVRQALYDLAAGLRSLGDALADAPTDDKTKEEREIALLLEFNRPDGQGLTQVEASKACKKHGFTPQTVGAWARADFLVTNKTEDPPRRYLTDHARNWLGERNVKLA